VRLAASKAALEAELVSSGKAFLSSSVTFSIIVNYLDFTGWCFVAAFLSMKLYFFKVPCVCSCLARGG